MLWSMGLHRVRYDWAVNWREETSAHQESADEFQNNIKTIEKKGYLPEQVFNADKIVLFWKNCHKRYSLISKRREKSLRQKGVSLLYCFCANDVRFMISSSLIYKAANPWALKGDDKHQPAVFRLGNKKPRTMRTLFFLSSSIDALSLKSENISWAKGTDF